MRTDHPDPAEREVLDAEDAELGRLIGRCLDDPARLLASPASTPAAKRRLAVVVAVLQATRPSR